MPLEPCKHNLTQHMATFHQSMRTFEVSRIERAQLLRYRCAQHTSVEQQRDFVENTLLDNHVWRSKQRAGEHHFPVERSAFRLQWRGIQAIVVVDYCDPPLWGKNIHECTE